MTKRDKTKMLRRVSLFDGIGPRALGQIADMAHEFECPANHYIVRQGQVSTGFYLITSGGVRVVRGRRTLARLGPGQFFGELALLDRAPRLAHVIADEPTTCLALASWDFLKLLERNSRVTLAILREVARRLRVLTDAPHA